jgi:hypothetical protein
MPRYGELDGVTEIGGELTGGAAGGGRDDRREVRRLADSLLGHLEGAAELLVNS